jgi:hypothetical protein
MGPGRDLDLQESSTILQKGASAVDLFAGSDILAPQHDNVGRYDVMNGSKTIYSEMVDIVSRYATDDGEHTTSIDGLSGCITGVLSEKRPCSLTKSIPAYRIRPCSRRLDWPCAFACRS